MMLPTRTAICLVLSLFLVATKCNGEEGYKPAPNCAKLDCPAYTVVHSQKEFEIRSYTDAQWISTPKIPSYSYEPAASTGFLTLFAYLKGLNLDHVQINMTAPVLVGVEDNTTTVYFYLPEKYQKKELPPKPLSDHIKVVQLPGHKYAAVTRFGGFLNDISIAVNVDALKKSLQSTTYQRAATARGYTIAGYNSPFEFTDRVNEIIFWFD